jgi:putative ABC transport system permease protein
MLDAFPNSISINKSTSTVVIFLIVFIVFELCYIWMIQRKSDEEIKKLKEIG